jgi:hypothetical protein
MSIKITFPDGAVREFNEGISAMEIAAQLSNSLPKKVLAAEVNGEVWDATRPLTQDSAVKLLTWNDTAGKSTFWHSSAHLMAEALEALYPGIKFGIGPPIEHGFYYDIDLLSGKGRRIQTGITGWPGRRPDHFLPPGQIHRPLPRSAHPEYRAYQSHQTDETGGRLLAWR